MLKPYYKRPEHVNVIINDENKNSLADQELEIPYLENNSLIYDFEDVIQASELNKHLHDKQMDRLRELLNKYSKCFSNNPGLTNLVEHEIQLVSDQPVRRSPIKSSPFLYHAPFDFDDFREQNTLLLSAVEGVRNTSVLFWLLCPIHSDRIRMRFHCILLDKF
ncbi:retrovirus-related Pol polyprotein from transposon 17.6 [Trichonephila clavipes]|nr:retrovirus-related Pol polyprotein from transposon 17.6 [Trichonephila clavipes]